MKKMIFFVVVLHKLMSTSASKHTRKWPGAVYEKGLHAPARKASSYSCQRKYEAKSPFITATCIFNLPVKRPLHEAESRDRNLLQTRKNKLREV
jgi:hypothetical protein